MNNNNKYPRIYLNRIQLEINDLDFQTRKSLLSPNVRATLRTLKKSYQQYEMIHGGDIFNFSTHEFYINNIYNVYLDLCTQIDLIKFA